MGNDSEFMKAAIAEALLGLKEGGVPIGSVVVLDGKIIGRGHNRRVQKGSVILHAELDALENAGRMSPDKYKRCTIYTTMSPCPMCSGAIRLYGIPRVVAAENKTFMGDEAILRSHGVKVDVLDSEECKKMMDDFIQEKPLLWRGDIDAERAAVTVSSRLTTVTSGAFVAVAALLIMAKIGIRYVN